MQYSNPMEFNGYTVTAGTVEVNPGRWQGTFTAEKAGESLATQWVPQFYDSREEAERSALEMARNTLGGII